MAWGLLLLIALVAALSVRGRRHDRARDAAWLTGADVVAADEAAVYAAYLVRHRTHRLVGGWFGVLFGVVSGIALTQGIHVGVSESGPLTDLLFCGVAGVLVGALSAETYRLRLPRAAVGGAVSASLAPRPEQPGATRVLVAHVLAGAALAASVLIGVTGDDWGPLAAGVLALVLLALCDATRAAARNRRRAALSARALVVDANLRTFTARTTAWLEVAVACLAVAWVPSGATPDGWWALVAFVVGLGGVVAAVVCLVKASPWPPRRVEPARLLRASAPPSPQPVVAGPSA